MEPTNDELTTIWAAYQAALAEAIARCREVDDASKAAGAPKTMEERQAQRKREARAADAFDAWRAIAEEWFAAHGR